MWTRARQVANREEREGRDNAHNAQVGFPGTGPFPHFTRPPALSQPPSFLHTHPAPQSARSRADEALEGLVRGGVDGEAKANGRQQERHSQDDLRERTHSATRTSCPAYCVNKWRGEVGRARAHAGVRYEGGGLPLTRPRVGERGRERGREGEGAGRKRRKQLASGPNALRPDLLRWSRLSVSVREADVDAKCVVRFCLVLSAFLASSCGAANEERRGKTSSSFHSPREGGKVR